MDNASIKKLESDLWESADLLRAGSKLTSNQYCMPVLGLLFLRYAYSRYKMVEEEILKDRPVRNGRKMPVEASDFTAKSALFLPEMAQFDYLVNLPENVASLGLLNVSGQTMGSLGEVVNNAMELVEQQSDQLTGVLPKSYTDFSDELLGELLRIFNNNALDEVGGDVIGRIYEYFLNKFAKNIASDDGVFFTPKSLVKMIVNILEPKSGVLLDPACGSGGMFVQTGDFVNETGLQANKSMTFYGQEKVEYNAQLCLMNMAVHGLTGVIKSGDEANSFYHDAHHLEGKTVFLSYCQKDKDIADCIDEKMGKLLEGTATLSRDIRDVEYHESFKKFMQSIEKHDYVISIISDNYLKSRNCMYEMLEVVKDSKFSQRLLFIVLTNEDAKYYKIAPVQNIGADVYSVSGQAKYSKFWSQMDKELDSEIEEIGNSIYAINQIKEEKIIQKILLDLPDFLEFVRENKGLSLTEHLENGFADMISFMEL